MLLTLCSGLAQAQSPTQPIQIRSFFVSPCEPQLRAAIDSAYKYQRLYVIERQISAKFRDADLISHGQYLKADSAYRNENKRAAVLADELNDAIGQAQLAEGRVKPLQLQNDRLRGKTKVGRLLRKVRNGLAGVGGLVFTAVTLKLIL